LLMVSHAPAAPYSRAMVALDSSLCACNALKAAYQLIPNDGQLRAVHILDKSLQLPTERQNEQLEIQRDLLQRLIDDELPQGSEPGVAVALDVRHGTLAGGLDEVIRE